MELIKVSTRSRPASVAGAIAAVMRTDGIVNVQAIGAGAVNQAIKAIAIARSYLEEEGLDVMCRPEFVEVEVEERTLTALRFAVTTA